MVERGWKVHLATDDRAERFAGHFPASEVHPIASATFGSKNPIALARSFWTIWRGVRQASEVIRRIKPEVAVGFGGYPTIPPLYAANRRGVPVIVHEQNAVMGRANKALAAKAAAIAGGFLPAGSGQYGAKTVVTGNPVRPAVLQAAATPYAAVASPASRSGCSSSAAARARSSSPTPFPRRSPRCRAEQRSRLLVTQQARADDVGRVKAAYAELGMVPEVLPFFTDMAMRIASAHLVISRSGASTVSEIAVIGRPAFLVPYPYALDHDQAANAEALAAAGGAEVHPQSTPLHRTALDPHRRRDLPAGAAGIHGGGGQIRGKTGRCAVARRSGRGYCVW